MKVSEVCVACEQCMDVCPAEAIYAEGTKVAIDNDSCIKCGECAATCPMFAISTEE